MAAVHDVEAGDCYVGDGACCSERCERPIGVSLPAEWPVPPQARALSIVGVETVPVRWSGRCRRGAGENVCDCTCAEPDKQYD